MPGALKALNHGFLFGLCMARPHNTCNYFFRRSIRDMEKLEILGTCSRQEEILTADALELLRSLVVRYAGARERMLALRRERQSGFDRGHLPAFLAETKAIRDASWTVAPIPEEARDRRTEITGPASRKMVINALNSGAQVFMADFEDATTPTWENLVEGQLNLRDAVNRTIGYTSPEGKVYALNQATALLMARPRGWHLPEKHVHLEGRPISGSLFDFALYLFHNQAALRRQGSHVYFYLPKLEHYLEARLWNEVINHAEVHLGLEPGSVKVTVLIETLPAAFQMHEILYELRSRIQGLNCGRWDYIFSYIKCLKNHLEYLLPDRSAVTMDKGFLKAYAQLLIKTCHQRGAMAMGGMAAQIPVRGDAVANRLAISRVRADKQREARAGHDGTWVAHPGLEPVARAEFDAVLTGPNQLGVKLEDVTVNAEDLLAPIPGAITEAGLRANIRVALLYLSAWLGGNGCVPIDHLMEDAATAEISRTQIWQWVRHPQARLEDGRDIDLSLYGQFLQEILAGLLQDEDADTGVLLRQAADLLDTLTRNDQLADFLTLAAYDMLVE